MENLMIGDDELASIRAQTRGCADLVHFNNAGSSLPPDVVLETVVNYLEEEAMMGGYEAETKYKGQIEGVYDAIARLINAERDELALFENASAAWGSAFKSLSFEPGDEIITSELEYVSNLIGLVEARAQGVVLKVIGNDGAGNFPLDELEAAIGPKTKLIAVTHIPSSGGGMIPIEEIGKIAASKGVLYMVDACQSAGQYPLDVKEIGCDILSVTGRKYLRAPRGTGFLFVRRSVQDRLKPFLVDHHAAEQVSMDGYTLRQDARRFELYEKSRALTLGLGRAAEYAMEIGMDRIWERVVFLAERLRVELETIPGLTVHDVGDMKCGIVTFSIAGKDAFDLKAYLSEKKINVSVGTSLATLIYMEKHELERILRASVHYYNTQEEIAYFVKCLKEVV